MSDYGSHPTIYGSLSDGELYALYRWETWSTLDEAHRQQLLQETVNRSAVQNGEKGSCEVVFADLGPGVAGEQSGSTIRVNRDFYATDTRMTAKNGQLCTETKQGNNMDALVTVLHEDQHAYQNQVIDGTIPAPDPSLQREYAANDFNTVNVAMPDGTTAPGATYIQGNDGEFGYYLYYAQSTERDAHRISEERATRIMEALEREYGTEPSFQAFRQEIEANGFEATMADMKETFGSDTVEHDVNASLMNRVYGTNDRVDPEVDRLVAKEIMETYRSVHRGVTAQGQAQKNPMGQQAEETTEADQKGISASGEKNETLNGSEYDHSEQAQADAGVQQEDIAETAGKAAEGYDNSADSVPAAQEAGEEDTSGGNAREASGEAAEEGAAADVGVDDDGGIDDEGGIE